MIIDRHCVYLLLSAWHVSSRFILCHQKQKGMIPIFGVIPLRHGQRLSDSDYMSNAFFPPDHRVILVASVDRLDDGVALL